METAPQTPTVTELNRFHAAVAGGGETMGSRLDLNTWMASSVGAAVIVVSGEYPCC